MRVSVCVRIVCINGSLMPEVPYVCYMCVCARLVLFVMRVRTHMCLCGESREERRVERKRGGYASAQGCRTSPVVPKRNPNDSLEALASRTYMHARPRAPMTCRGAAFSRREARICSMMCVAPGSSGRPWGPSPPSGTRTHLTCKAGW